ncbi:hypothetical protein RUM44_001446 [Polyplax serrata]|uniref:H/ACA ribonucleoprotein complex non-core subunit NAF1 n=1 Tax=Polyplax serrata TaxID=468196 RepID=A0ABR1ALI5_POLSC
MDSLSNTNITTQVDNSTRQSPETVLVKEENIKGTEVSNDSSDATQSRNMNEMWVQEEGDTLETGVSSVVSLMDDNIQNNTVNVESVVSSNSETHQNADSVASKVNIAKNNDCTSSTNNCNDNTSECKLITSNQANTATIQKEATDGNLDNAVVIINKALCANYRSGSESDSVDSESDSSSTDSSSSSDCSKEESKNRKYNKKSSGNGISDFSISSLPPIEDLKISVPEKECVEIGVITSIVDTLVIVESYKGTAALDIDTVLFLDSGKRPLGKVFEILGPVSEPVYAVRFNDQDQITCKMIEKGLKVYYAPQTQHTTFVHLSEVLKCRGSDASWKDNIEAPSEFQDFSDDEEENKFKKMFGGKGENSTKEGLQGSRKRTFSNQQNNAEKIIQPSRFKNSNVPNPRFTNRGNFRSSHPRNPIATAQARSHFSIPRHNNPYVPRGGGPMNYYPPPPFPYHASHFQGFAYPNYGNVQFFNPSVPGMPPPYYMQTTQTYHGSYRPQWPVPPAPPPPLSHEGDKSGGQQT